MLVQKLKKSGNQNKTTRYLGVKFQHCHAHHLTIQVPYRGHFQNFSTWAPPFFYWGASSKITTTNYITYLRVKQFVLTYTTGNRKTSLRNGTEISTCFSTSDGDRYASKTIVLMMTARNTRRSNMLFGIDTVAAQCSH